MSSTAPENLDEYEQDLDAEVVDDDLSADRGGDPDTDIGEAEPGEFAADKKDIDVAHVEPTAEDIEEMDRASLRGRIS